MENAIVKSLAGYDNSKRLEQLAQKYGKRAQRHRERAERVAERLGHLEKSGDDTLKAVVMQITKAHADLAGGYQALSDSFLNAAAAT